jgi:ABC-type dipeptide/oligopeptide/nickel transport system ATPase component
MTTKELIQAEIKNLSEEELRYLYCLVKEFTRSKSKNQKSSLMSRLRKVKIDAPEDFADNYDLYMSGEKSFE